MSLVFRLGSAKCQVGINRRLVRASYRFYSLGHKYYSFPKILFLYIYMPILYTPSKLKFFTYPNDIIHWYKFWVLLILHIWIGYSSSTCYEIYHNPNKSSMEISVPAFFKLQSKFACLNRNGGKQHWILPSSLSCS